MPTVYPLIETMEAMALASSPSSNSIQISIRSPSQIFGETSILSGGLGQGQVLQPCRGKTILVSKPGQPKVSTSNGYAFSL